MVCVSVILALPQRQQRVSLQVAPGTPVRDVLRQALDAGLDLSDSGLNPDTVPLAVYAEPVDDTYLPREGDRLELLRPLRQAPMTLRRQRAGGRKGRP